MVVHLWVYIWIHSSMVASFYHNSFFANNECGSVITFSTLPQYEWVEVVKKQLWQQVKLGPHPEPLDPKPEPPKV